MVDFFNAHDNFTNKRIADIVTCTQKKHKQKMEKSWHDLPFKHVDNIAAWAIAEHNAYEEVKITFERVLKPVNR